MEVWKPPNYRLPDVRKENELQAQLLLVNRGSSCGKNNYTNLICSIAMDGRHSYTDDISICCSLSVLLCYCPQKTQSEKLLFCNRKPIPQYHRTKEMTQTRKIPENQHLQKPKAIFFSLLNLD